MKKSSLVIFLSILIILGCSDESPVTETLEITLSSSVTMNENSNLVSLQNPAGDNPTYEVPILFNRLNGTQSVPESNIKSITIKQVSYSVNNYECSPEEIMTVIEWPNKYGSADLSVFTLKENQSSSFYLYSPGSRTILEKNLLSQGHALVYWRCTIPKENSTFDIRLSLDMDISIEYIKD